MKNLTYSIFAATTATSVGKNFSYLGRACGKNFTFFIKYSPLRFGHFRVVHFYLPQPNFLKLAGKHLRTCLKVFQ